MMTKKYDVILYGASGFTGRQTIAYFLKHAPSDLRWAIAGRNLDKLTSVCSEEVGDRKEIDVLVADSKDVQAIQNLVRSTRVLLTTAGPYNLYGKTLLEACAEQGVDYVDITGETAFIRSVMDTHEEKARSTGAKIIPFSGFDSVPSDLGVYAITEYLREKKDTKTKSVRGIFSIKGSFNGGTLLSMLNMFETGDWKKMSDPSLLMREPANGVRLISDSYEAKFEPRLNRWIAPFVMSMINTRVVNRSAHLSNSFGSDYGPNFCYTEHQNVSDWWNPVPAYVYASAFKSFTSLGNFSAVREMIRKLGPSASEGPSENSMNNGYYHLDAFGEGHSGEQVRLEFSGKGDPGNRATILFLCESALALAIERKNLPGGESRSGFLTPATGLGNVLLNRLKKKDVNIAITEIKKKEVGI